MVSFRFSEKRRRPEIKLGKNHSKTEHVDGWIDTHTQYNFRGPVVPGLHVIGRTFEQIWNKLTANFKQLYNNYDADKIEAG